MSDTSGHDAPPRDDLHTMTLDELEARVAEAGLLISRRQLMRHCEAQTFDAKKIPAVNNIKYWFIAPGSVDKGIADIKTLQEQRARRDQSRPDMSGHDDLKISNSQNTDTTRHDGSQPDMAGSQNKPSSTGESSTTRPDMSGHDASGFDVYDHPYVKRLEDRVEKLEAKYEAQVHRTEEIQMKSQQQIIELQRMTAIGQSQTLADFMLKAREWVLGQGSEADKTDSAPANSTA